MGVCVFFPFPVFFFPPYLRPDVDVEAAEPGIALEALDHFLPMPPHQIDAELGGQRADAQLRDAPGADQRVDAQPDRGFWAALVVGEEGGDAVELLEGVGVEVDAVRCGVCVCRMCGGYEVGTYMYVYM